MARSTAVLLAFVAVGAAATAWWFVGRDDGRAEVPRAEAPDGGPPTVAPPTSVEVTTPAVAAADAPAPAAEAVAQEGERLPDIRVGERGRVARFRREVFRDGMELSGEVLLKGLVEARDVWVRWDTEATRDRFVRQKFLVPGMQALESGEAVVFVQPMPDLFRHFGFSCRLEGSVLRIGAEGVYRPDEPPPGPSPR